MMSASTRDDLNYYHYVIVPGVSVTALIDRSTNTHPTLIQDITTPTNLTEQSITGQLQNLAVVCISTTVDGRFSTILTN